MGPNPRIRRRFECWHRACTYSPADANCANKRSISGCSRKRRRTTMKAHLKSVVLGLALVTVLAGLSACAKREDGRQAWRDRPVLVVHGRLAIPGRHAVVRHPGPVRDAVAV